MPGKCFKSAVIFSNKEHACLDNLARDASLMSHLWLLSMSVKAHHIQGHPVCTLQKLNFQTRLTRQVADRVLGQVATHQACLQFTFCNVLRAH